MTANNNSRRTDRSTERTRRGAFTLFETLVAFTLFAAFCGMLTPLVFKLGNIREQLNQREFALNVLRNLVEQGLHQSPAAPLAPTDETLAILPECKYSRQITADPSFPDAQRVELKLSWSPAPSRPREHVVLSYWVLPTTEAGS